MLKLQSLFSQLRNYTAR